MLLHGKVTVVLPRTPAISATLLDNFCVVKIEAEQSWMAFWGFPNSMRLSESSNFI
jgi:hypothetical protein